MGRPGKKRSRGQGNGGEECNLEIDPETRHGKPESGIRRTTAMNRSESSCTEAQIDSPAYCESRFRCHRRRTREVRVGGVGVGGDNPIRIQSMTTSDTKDVAATVEEATALAGAGCEIIRVTAPNVTAARCLREIRSELDRRGILNPLVADIHFLPAAAMEAVEHVEKVRINPGNYADRKKFAVREYSDSQYNEELERLYEAFSPIVRRCRELGRSMRIGTNHGSLSDRILNRYGDTPLGMVESALEFLRIAESHGFRDIILSMKASNPKVMIQAYRLLVHRMERENMHYPLHLGVTEAGDGEDGRIKSAIGIGSLLADGLGDTIRVSLTEDAVHEIPVARAIADRAEKLWKDAPPPPERRATDSIDPFEFRRRRIAPVSLGPSCPVASDRPPRVVARLPHAIESPAAFARSVEAAREALGETPLEGVECPRIEDDAAAGALARLPPALEGRISALVVPLSPKVDPASLEAVVPPENLAILLRRRFRGAERETLGRFLDICARRGFLLAAEIPPADFPALEEPLRKAPRDRLVFTLSEPVEGCHAVGSYRYLAEALRTCGLDSPVWIRNTREMGAAGDETFLGRLLDASVLTGTLLCDGIGDLVSVETEDDLVRSTRLAYNILQGAGARISRTEFIACPSCGRTLFNLQETTRRIREKTGHLKGVRIAVMGCIVNGPGEMADADFGYVGGAPGRVNLYVGRDCVRYHVPEDEADERLIELIREHGKWTEPPVPAGNP